MELYEKIRNRQEDLINQNPTSIIISRTSRSRGTDGGLSDNTEVLDAQIVRIYNKANLITVVTEAGYTHIRACKMIVKYNGDVIKRTENNVDKFSADGLNYEIVDVKPITTQGQVVFNQCYIEQVD